MRIQTFSIVVGTRACNAKCSFCVSRMTGFGEIPKRGEIYTPNFRKACRLAKLGGTTTVLMTGKGEPTLYPVEIDEYLVLLAEHHFPLIELQTNVLEIGWLVQHGHSRIPGLTRETLVRWRETGLNTIAISVVSERSEHNRAVYHEDYPDLATMVAFLHDIGFTVRLCVMMQKGAVDTPERLREVVDFCRTHRIEQLTARPIRTPVETRDDEASLHVRRYGLHDGQVRAMRLWVETNGTKLLSLMHGAAVYDVGGQNCCLSDCLTLDASSDDIRTLIFYSDGRITYDWQYDGAVLLGPGRVTA